MPSEARESETPDSALLFVGRHLSRGPCQKSGSRGCAQGRAVQATRITLRPNRVLGRYVDIALAWGVIGRSNGIAHPDTIEHFFAVPLQAAGVAQQGRRYVLEDVDAIDGAEVATVKPVEVFPARFVDDIAVNDGSWSSGPV